MNPNLTEILDRQETVEKNEFFELNLLDSAKRK
jgi:hypothetical protein